MQKSNDLFNGHELNLVPYKNFSLFSLNVIVKRKVTIGLNKYPSHTELFLLLNILLNKRIAVRIPCTIR